MKANRSKSRRPRAPGSVVEKRKLALALDRSREELEIQNESLLQTQIELEVSRERYADLYDAAPVCFATLTGAGVVREMNLAAVHFLGRNRNSLVGWPFVNWIATSDRKRFFQHLARCRQNPDPTHPLSVELEIVCQPHQAKIFIQLISTPAPGKLPRTEAVFKCVFIDITEQKRAHEALRESEARFRNLANTAPVLIWITDKDKQFTWFNDRWLHFTGRGLEQEAGSGWRQGLHPEE